jgi:uncharacterized protein (DUF1800 family)
MRRATSDLASPWAPFTPSRTSPWDLAAVAHLHRRAGFAAPRPILDRDLADGPDAAVQRLLRGEPTTRDGHTTASEFDSQSDDMARRVGASASDLSRLQSTWILRLINTPHPLRERLTLFWHDHFATSNAKVRSPDLMRRQNALLRQYALGDFRALLRDMARDPAMLVWLDATTNRRAHPNENYAREVMELFALGRGQYAEKDIQEAARAFTGAFIQSDRYEELPAQHDDGPKTILGRTGHFHADDVAHILLDQPACAEYVCSKLYSHFLTDVEPPPPQVIGPLAEAFRHSDYDIAVPVRLILASQRFFDPAFRAQRVKSPIELIVGTIRALEVHQPTIPPDQLVTAADAMGQSLFLPPSVNGWDTGLAWLNTTTSLARTNFLLGLIADSKRFRPAALIQKAGANNQAPRFFADLLLPRPLDPGLTSQIPSDPAGAAAAILTMPEYQLA